MRVARTLCRTLCPYILSCVEIPVSETSQAVVCALETMLAFPTAYRIKCGRALALPCQRLQRYQCNNGAAADRFQLLVVEANKSSKQSGQDRSTGLDPSLEAPVPSDQRPVNELLQLKDSPLCSWVSSSTGLGRAWRRIPAYLRLAVLAHQQRMEQSCACLCWSHADASIDPSLLHAGSEAFSGVPFAPWCRVPGRGHLAGRSRVSSDVRACRRGVPLHSFG